MYISIKVKPTFALQPSLAMVNLLMQMSELHYDGKCKSMSLRGGLFYGWRNAVEYANNTNFQENDSTGIVYASFSELDLTLKVCENLYLLDNDDQALIDPFVKQILRALTLCNRQLSNLHWELGELSHEPL